MTLYLVRHGLAAAGLSDLDPGLAAIGHQQALATAAALGLRLARSTSDSPPTLIVSPLRRTRETAEPIARVLGAAAAVRREVAEVFAPAMPADERQAMIGPFMAGFWPAQPAPLQEWRSRLVAFLVEVGGGPPRGARDVVVVSHYIAIAAAIGAATGDDRVVPVPIANASVTALTVSDGRLILVEAGSTAHLAPGRITGLAQALPGAN